MSFEELSALQANVEEEMRTRNVKKLDFKSLETLELQELILQCLRELCTREDFGEWVTINQYKSIKSWYSAGAYLLFNDTNGHLLQLILTDENMKRTFKTTVERTLEETAQIKIQ